MNDTTSRVTIRVTEDERSAIQAVIDAAHHRGRRVTHSSAIRAALLLALATPEAAVVALITRATERALQATL
jgi:hypothetical protein